MGKNKTLSLLTEKRVYEIIIGFLVFCVGFLIVYEEKEPFETSIESDFAELEDGKYLRMVYIGSAECSHSNNENMHQLVKDLKKSLRKVAHNNNLKFVSTGIAVDMNVYRGVKFLKKTAPYDELLTGASWFNLGIHRYAWKLFPAKASTPQILLTITNFQIVPAGNAIGNIKRNEQLLERFKGVGEIEKLYSMSQSPEKIFSILKAGNSFEEQN